MSLNIDTLREALWTVDDAEPAIRLLAVIAYQHGVSQTELADWFGVSRKTIHNWLVRFEERPDSPITAARNAPRSGRPAKLSEGEREELLEQLRSPPSGAWHGHETWTPELVRRHVVTNYGCNYSLESCRRLLRDAGLVYREPASDERVDIESGRRWLPCKDE